jgi:TatA/E family protein of Tat protein translocase
MDADAHFRRRVVPDEGLLDVRRGRSRKSRTVAIPGLIGIQEIVLLVVVLLVIFGVKRLPEIGRSLGHGMREFKYGVNGKK